MPELSLAGLPVTPGSRWAAAALAALAREEQLERRPRRVLEPGHATWRQFRGRLGWTHYLQLLTQDAAVTHPVPFDAQRVLGTRAAAIADIPGHQIEAWLARLDGPVTDGAEYVREQARRLGCPTQFARSNLHQIKPHHRVLELPGTGGQLAHHVATTQPHIYIQDVFTVACATWEELTLAGLIALELRAPSADFARLDPQIASAGGSGYDYVFGLAPDKGGPLDRERLAELFAPAIVVLV